MIRIEDFGEIAYGGVVTLSEWWDNKRIVEGKITSKDIFKKAGFYSYVGIGLAATLMSVFGWQRRYERWQEHISHGFMYDLPRFGYNLAQSMGTAGKGKTESRAIQEAQQILKERARTNKLLAEGRVTDRTYQPEMEQATAF